MKLEDFDGIIKNLKQKHIDKDVDVEIYSAFGGMTCWVGKLSEVLGVIDGIKDRAVNVDYFVTIWK